MHNSIKLMLLVSFLLLPLTWGCSGRRAANNDNKTKAETNDKAAAKKSAPDKTKVVASEEVQSLLDRIESNDPDARTEAAIALISYPEQATSFVEPLVGLLTDPKTNPQLAASLAFQELATHSLDSIKALLDSGDQSKYTQACQAIHEVGTAAQSLIPQLAEGLKSSEPQIRKASIYALIPMGSLAKEHVPAIAELVSKEKDFNTQVFACRALINMGSDAQPAAQEIIALANNGILSSRSYAYWTLGAMGPIEDFDTTAFLVEKLDAFMRPERERALRGLGLLGKHAESAVEKIKQLAADQGANVEPVAAFVLWQVTGDDEQTVKLLVDLYENPTHQFEALGFLHEMGAAARSAEKFFSELLTNSDESLREKGVQCLGNIGTDKLEIIEKIQEISQNDPDPMVRLHATRALEKLQPKND